MFLITVLQIRFLHPSVPPYNFLLHICVVIVVQYGPPAIFPGRLHVKPSVDRLFLSVAVYALCLIDIFLTVLLELLHQLETLTPLLLKP